MACFRFGFSLSEGDLRGHKRGLSDPSPTHRAEEEVVLREIKEVTEVGLGCYLSLADFSEVGELAGHFSLA